MGTNLMAAFSFFKSFNDFGVRYLLRIDNIKNVMHLITYIYEIIRSKKGLRESTLKINLKKIIEH